jgi:hypothetical protein
MALNKSINKIMIAINGLSKKQIAMLNIIWSCEGEEQFLDWFCSLPYADKLTVESLLQCLFYEFIEGRLDTECTDAKEVLSKF